MPDMVTGVLGVVLAGGRSSRMGRDKAAIEFGGAALVERAVSILRPVFDEVLVAGGSTATPSVPVLADRVRGGGPLAGLDAAYAASEGRAIFLLAVDMPFVDSDMVRCLVEPQPDDHCATVALSDGNVQPLCSVYGAKLAAVVRQHLDSDDRSMARFVSAIHRVRYVEIGGAVAVNINTHEDLKKARRRLSS